MVKTRFTRIYPLLIGSLVVLVIAANLLFGLILIHNDRWNCTQLENIKAGTRIQLIQSNKRLGTIQYYKDHPDELKAARAADNALIKLYGPSNCAGIYGGH